MNWNGAIYTYVHNYQGDIIAILDSDGSAVVEYYYDAWGRQYSVSGTMADTLGKLNPFRYRGYVYDEETGLYYLKSRYYNPEWGRFINADILLGKRGALLSHNLFAYCANNPITRVDTNGNSWRETYKEAWRRMVSGLRDAFNCIEFEAGAGMGIGKSNKIMGIAGASYFMSYDGLYVSFDNGEFSIDRAIVIDAGVEFFDIIEVGGSGRQKQDIANPKNYIPFDWNEWMNIMGIVELDQPSDELLGYSWGIGKIYAAHYTVAFNLTEWAQTKTGIGLERERIAIKQYLEEQIIAPWWSNVKRLVGLN